VSPPVHENQLSKSNKLDAEAIWLYQLHPYFGRLDLSKSSRVAANIPLGSFSPAFYYYCCAPVADSTNTTGQLTTLFICRKFQPNESQEIETITLRYITFFTKPTEKIPKIRNIRNATLNSKCNIRNATLNSKRNINVETYRNFILSYSNVS
jgi:hypothetical protein